MPVQPRAVRLLGVLFVTLVFFGCERLREVKRCQQLARDVNGSLDRVELQVKLGETRAVYENVSHEYDAIAHNLDTFDGGTPELKTAVTEFAGVARTSARQAASLAQALATDNRANASLATRELQRLARHEKIVAARIDEECRPHSDR